MRLVRLTKQAFLPGVVLVYLFFPSVVMAQDPRCGGADSGLIDTALGCIPVGSTDAFAGFLIGWGLGVGGGVALILIAFAGVQLMTAGGDPKKVQAAKELLTAAVAGLLFISLSAFLLRLVGVNIFGISELGTT